MSTADRHFATVRAEPRQAIVPTAAHAAKTATSTGMAALLGAMLAMVGGGAVVERDISNLRQQRCY